MNLDSMARASADELLDASRGAGSASDLDRLVRASRRRTGARVIAGAVAAAVVVLAGSMLLAPSSRQDTTPAQRDGLGTIVSTSEGYKRDSILVRHGRSVHAIYRVGGIRLHFVQDLAVDHEGQRLAVVADGKLLVTSLEGQLLWSVPCRSTCLWVDWVDGNDVVLLTARERGSLVSTRFTEDGLSRGSVDLPDGAPATAISPDGSRLVGVERTGPRADDPASLVITTLDGVHRVALSASAVPRGWTVVDVSWAPDGQRLGYLLQGPPRGPDDETEYVLRTVRPDGTDAVEVADLGRCLCLGWFPPTFAWAPDSASFVAVRVLRGSNGPPPEAVVLDLEGRETGQTVSGGSPVDWGPGPSS